MPAPPIRNSTAETPEYGSPPEVGEHTDSIKREFSA
jgi:crotonobetainyl-CoA:carnitine CoA-transferase CaiB-like acyl-CoA transferase